MEKHTHKTLLIIISETGTDTHLQMEYYISLLYENRCIYRTLQSCAFPKILFRL